MPQLVLLVGCPGAGKTTYCTTHLPNHTRISQDDQGPKGHKALFEIALAQGNDIVVDRQNHIRIQREQYLAAAKAKDYTTKIVWFKVDKELCEKRILDRVGHPSIDESSDVRTIVKTYERNLEAPSHHEVDELEEIYVPFFASIQDLTHLQGRIGVFGDVHGVWNETKLAIDSLNLDHYVFLGDLNDRGPDYLKILEFVRSRPNVYVLEGNHEHKLKRWLKGNRVAISQGLHMSISQLECYTEEQKRDLYHWIQSLPTIVKLPLGYVGVHAGFDLTKPLDQQKYATCLWIRRFGRKFDDEKDPFWFEIDQHRDLKYRTILFGHTVLDKIHVAKNIRALDGGAVYGGELRVCVIDTSDKSETIHTYKCPKYYDRTATRPSDFFAKREALVTSGYLSRSERDNLVLYNYTDKCTFDRNWSKVTLQSRGTIFDRTTGALVAKTFDKFFNLGEIETSRLERLPLHLPFQVFEKMDGSLGILYRYKDSWHVATRGSFYSDQAKRATKMLERYDLSTVPKHISFSFEIIYPENKIVVPYGEKEELVVLAAFDNKTGEELSWKKTCKLAKQAGFSTAGTYDYSIDQLVDMAKHIPHTMEGWVLRFENGLRIKIKGADYLRIAKILSHMTPLSIWEAIVEAKIDDYIVSIPEELRPEAESIRDRLYAQHEQIKQYILLTADRLQLVRYIDLATSKEEKSSSLKEAAQLIQQNADSWIQSLLYMFIRNGDWTSAIYKKLRPKDNQYVDIQSLFNLKDGT